MVVHGRMRVGGAWWWAKQGRWHMVVGEFEPVAHSVGRISVNGAYSGGRMSVGGTWWWANESRGRMVVSG